MPPPGNLGNIPVASCGAKVTDVDATPLRRLTNAEYLNSVSDLLGDVSALKLDFAAELTTENYPFQNKAAETARRAVLMFQYLTAARRSRPTWSRTDCHAR